MTLKVQEAQNSGTAVTTVAAVLGATPQAGNLLVAVATSNSGFSSPTVTFSSTPDFIGAGAAKIAFFSKIADGTESKTVTLTNGAGRNMTLSVVEVSPTANMGWVGLDKTASATDATGVTSITVGPTSALSSADQLAVAAVVPAAGIGGTPTFTNSYTLIGSPALIARGFAGWALLAAATATSTVASWVTSGNASGALATYKQATNKATRTGTATLVLSATSTSKEVEKSAASASVTLTATATAKPVVPVAASAGLVLNASATSVQVDKRAVTADLKLTATATSTEVHVRTGSAALVLGATATAVPDGGVHTRTGEATIALTGTATGSTAALIRTGTATIILEGTAVARAILTRTGLAALELDATATATPPGGIYTRTGVAAISLSAGGPAITVHPRTGEASLAINQENVARSYVVERRTGTAFLTLTADAVSTVIERRPGEAAIHLVGTGHIARIARDVTVLAVIDRQRQVTIRPVHRLVRIEPRP